MIKYVMNFSLCLFFIPLFISCGEGEIEGGEIGTDVLIFYENKTDTAIMLTFYRKEFNESYTLMANTKQEMVLFITPPPLIARGVINNLPFVYDSIQVLREGSSAEMFRFSDCPIPNNPGCVENYVTLKKEELPNGSIAEEIQFTFE